MEIVQAAAMSKHAVNQLPFMNILPFPDLGSSQLAAVLHPCSLFRLFIRTDTFLYLQIL